MVVIKTSIWNYRNKLFVNSFEQKLDFIAGANILQEILFSSRHHGFICEIQDSLVYTS